MASPKLPGNEYLIRVIHAVTQKRCQKWRLKLGIVILSIRSIKMENTSL